MCYCVCFIFVHAEFVRIKLMMMMISGLSANIASKKWVSLSPGNVNNLYVCEPDRLRKKKTCAVSFLSSDRCYSFISVINVVINA